MKLEALFDQPQALPSAPSVVQELINSFADEDVSTNEIARKIAADQVLSAKLLRLANSAHYHVSRSIGTVDHAVTMLGFVTVRTLVISSGLTGSFKPIKGFDLEYFWRYSLHTAVVAKWLARKTKQNQDMAFTIGLMHAIGLLVMHTGMPEQCAQIDAIAAPWSDDRLDVEKTALGYDFATVSAELATRWRFPADFSATIAAFPEPLTPHLLEQAPLNKMAVIIHLAAWFARAQKNALSVEQMQAVFPAEIGASIGLTFDEINEEMPSLDELSEGLDVLITG
jgi:HD-like signal output (HDOD) protein